MCQAENRWKVLLDTSSLLWQVSSIFKKKHCAIHLKRAVSSSLIIYFTPYTNMSASAIIALAELALKNEMDVVDIPSFLGLPDYTPLAVAAEASGESEFERLMLLLSQWCEQRRPSGCLDLTIRVGPSKLLIEQTIPVEGHQAIAALLVDIVETVGLLRQASLLKHVTRIQIMPGSQYGGRAYISDRLAYLVRPRIGVVTKAPAAGDMSLL